MENVVTAIFEVESEAYKAFTELRNKPAAEGYSVVEASLLKRDGDNIVIADAFDAAGVTSDDTAAGMVVGALVGILGGPLGVILGCLDGIIAVTIVRNILLRPHRSLCICQSQIIRSLLFLGKV